jgi:hypothetical protein
MTSRDARCVSLKQLSYKFEEKIRRGSGIRIRPGEGRWSYDAYQKQWFGGAYRTIQKTLHGRYAPMTDEHKKSCSDLIWRELPILTVDRFDDAVGDIIDHISDNFKVSVGHAQKLVSILAKYAFVVYQLNSSSLPEVWREFVRLNQCRLLVPYR